MYMQVANILYVKRQLHSTGEYSSLTGLTPLQEEADRNSCIRESRIIRVLEDANIKLSSVVSHRSGGSATYLISGLMKGRKDFEKLVSEYYHIKLQATSEQIVESINGRLTPHLKFLIKSMQKHIQAAEEQLVEIYAEIEKHIKDFEQ